MFPSRYSVVLITSPSQLVLTTKPIRSHPDIGTNPVLIVLAVPLYHHRVLLTAVLWSFLSCRAGGSTSASEETLWRPPALPFPTRAPSPADRPHRPTAGQWRSSAPSLLTGPMSSSPSLFFLPPRECTVCVCTAHFAWTGFLSMDECFPAPRWASPCRLKARQGSQGDKEVAVDRRQFSKRVHASL